MKLWQLWKPLLIASGVLWGQQTTINSQLRSGVTAVHSIVVIDVVPHFVTTIRVPETVNSVVVGDPTLFQAEHSEHEPELVFVKALTTQAAESNLLIASVKGRQFSFLLVSHGLKNSPDKVDFLFRYQPASGFLVAPEALPFANVSETVPLESSVPAPHPREPESGPQSPPHDLLDELLERQKRAPLPALSSLPIENRDGKTAGVGAGISEVIDRGQQVTVRFSVVDRGPRAILLMAPQVQLGGMKKTGKFIKHQRWLTAEQLPVSDFRLSRRRIAPGERADGVVQFERPPYKQSNESLFLQMAESGAVDKPVLVPIGFGVSTAKEVTNHDQ
ncbi:MAG: hypothetical protein JO356_19920 [Acidobacteria bacterium]|nr:hypothetical protein [Acidobacteriota bacterium]